MFNRTCSKTPEMTMTRDVGPDGRPHRRFPFSGKWIALTIIAVTMLGLVIVGKSNMSMLLSYIGL